MSIYNGTQKVAPLDIQKVYVGSTKVYEETMPSVLVSTVLSGVSNPKRYQCSASVGTDVYIYGGSDDGSNGFTGNVYKYDTLLNTYTSYASMSVRAGGTVVDSTNNTFTAIGGVTTQNVNFPALGTYPKIQTYDIANGYYNEISNTNYNDLVFTCAVKASDGYYYTFGGGSTVRGSDNQTHNKVYKIDSSTGSRSQVGSLSNRRKAAVCYYDSANNDVYIIGGVNNSGSKYSSIEKYNLTTNTSSIINETLPYATQMMMSAPCNNGIYIIGGFVSDSGITDLDTIYKFTVNNGTVSLTNTNITLPKHLYAGTACRVGKWIYIFGGVTNNGSDVLNNTVIKFYGKI